jgi:glycosyltransferase involved in cell wall biosynthesis
VGVLFDIQGVQSRAHGERGIARYLTGLALALEDRHAERISSFLLNPDLAVPGAIEPLASAGRLSYPEHLPVAEADAYHVGSAIELDVPFDRVWPESARRVPLIVTLYDLIPEVFSHLYLGDAALRRRYRTRIQLLRFADRVLAISKATARDAIERLGLSEDRIRFVGAGVADHFRPAARREAALDALMVHLPRVRPGFVLYTGGIDHRKNVDRLLLAYSALSKRIRDAHQLVIVCRVLPEEQRALDARLEKLQLTEHVVFPGFVPDAELVLLYQATDLFVFPSLYEGFGLPVAEAMACGAPVITSNTSSLVELVEDPAARFDPTRPREIADAMRRTLRDADLRARLRSHGLDSRWRWHDVADRTGVADYSHRMLGELVKLVDVDAFVVAGHGREAPEGIQVRSLSAFEAAQAAGHGYDSIVVSLGNSEHHAEALAFLARRPAVVLAHEIRFSGLYAWTSHHRPDLEPRSFQTILHELYPRRLPESLGEDGWLDFAQYERHGVFMAREVVARSTRFLAHTEYAATLARLDAAPEDAAKIGVVPYGFPDSTRFREPEPDEALVATFGLVAPVKQTLKLVEAFALVVADRPEARLAIVGPSVSSEESARIRETVDRLSLNRCVDVTGDVSWEAYTSWLQRTTVAVQLRAASNGETSGAVADCLTAGAPTIATAIGATRDLPADCVVKVERDASALDLAAEIAALLDDPTWRKTLSQAGRDHAAAWSIGRAAEALVEMLLGERSGVRRARRPAA